MYVGDDVLADFYGWVSPKCDHVAVGMGAATHEGEISRSRRRKRCGPGIRIEGGKIIRGVGTSSTNGGCSWVCDQVLWRGDLLGCEEWEDVRRGSSGGLRKYWPTYKVLDELKKVFYRSNASRESFMEMCADDHVQKMTFDSYLYKRVMRGNPLENLKLAANTIGSLMRASAWRREMNNITS